MGRRFPEGLTPILKSPTSPCFPRFERRCAREDRPERAPDAFPSLHTSLDFSSVCRTRGIAFQRTAGLHHPVRCYRALTYAAEGPSG